MGPTTYYTRTAGVHDTCHIYASALVVVSPEMDTVSPETVSMSPEAETQSPEIDTTSPETQIFLFVSPFLKTPQ